jgi:protein-S-isoprenylcysteine O-methyltransferase Ste14
MHPETPFRLAFLAVMLSAACTAARFRIRAHRAGGSVSRRGEGWFMLLTLRPLALVLWVAALVYLIRPDAIAWARLPLPAAWRWLGFALAMSAAPMIYWTFSHLGHNLTDTVAVRSAATLVTSGPYRLVRHPFYVSCSLIFAGVFLLTANWLIGLTGLLILTLLAVRTRREETELIARFGDAYRRYMATTGRFVPRFSRGSGNKT